MSEGKGLNETLRKHINNEDNKQRWEKLSKQKEAHEICQTPLDFSAISCLKIPEGKLTNLQAAGLEIMYLMQRKVFDDQNKMTDDQQKIVSDFLLQILNDKKSAKEFANVLKEMISVNQHDSEAQAMLANVRKFCYKTRHYDNNKIPNIIKKLSSTAGDNQEKVTLREFGQVRDAAFICGFTDNLSKQGFTLEQNHPLEKEVQYSKSVKDKIAELDGQLYQDLGKIIGGGVMLLDHFDKKEDLKNTIAGIYMKFISYFSKHMHASMMLKDNDKDKDKDKIIKSELSDKYKNTKQLDTYEYLGANIYQIDVISLIDEKYHAILRSTYGEKWQSVIAIKFQNIERGMHTHKFDYITAGHKGVEFLSGLADVIPFGHKQISKNDFKEIHKKVTANKGKHVYKLCSTFCAETIIASLVSLNQEIDKDITDSSKKSDYPYVDFDLKVDNVVKIPFGVHENLSVMHTDRMLKHLTQKGCIKKITTSVDKFITQDDKSKGFFRST